MSFTQHDFDQLPPLLSRGVFLAWTGWRSTDLSKAVKSGEIKTCRRAGHKKALYYKAEAAQWTKLKM